MKRVLKWTVPVDDRIHLIGRGPVLHVDCQFHPEAVQVWTVEDGDQAPTRPAYVVGTGQPLASDKDTPLGTAVVSAGLVWHVVAAAE